MMGFYIVSWFLLNIIVLFNLLTTTLGDVKYALEFTDSIMSCPDFENKVVNAEGVELGVTPGEDGQPDIFGMSGPLELFEALNSDHEITLEVCKTTEVTCEPMMSAAMSMCKSIEKEDAPWFPVWKMMNVSGCPVEPGSYPIKNLVISTEPFEDCINHNFVGNYEITLFIVDTSKAETLSCNKVYMEMVEKQTDD